MDDIDLRGVAGEVARIEGQQLLRRGQAWSRRGGRRGPSRLTLRTL